MFLLDKSDAVSGLKTYFSEQSLSSYDDSPCPLSVVANVTTASAPFRFKKKIAYVTAPSYANVDCCISKRVDIIIEKKLFIHFVWDNNIV